MNTAAHLILAMADDALILGHRNSEWTGIGPFLEEDLAFSSMAQDKIGHAQALYALLHSRHGAADPDTLAFLREEKDMRCCHLVELPIGEYDFSIVRHYLFDKLEWLRYDDLAKSADDELARLARKVRGEVKYHVMHANTWMRQLAQGNEESKARIQSSLQLHWNIALGMFEPLEGEEELVEQGLFSGHSLLFDQWMSAVAADLSAWGLKLPETNLANMEKGGRRGYHTEYLQSLLEEMGEVIRSESGAEW
jgi:ring-1,2-phenylacetyl-CoA epoxidase subunit PaaC